MRLRDNFARSTGPGSTFRENVKQELYESGDPAGPEFSVQTYGDIDDTTWDLAEIFEDYFPTLQRSAAVVTIYAVFERELIGLCRQVQKLKEPRAGVKDMHGTGIEQAVSYLDLVCGIDPSKGSMELLELKKIQTVRGALAHGSKVNLAQSSKLRAALAHSGHLGWKGDETDAELTVAAPYLQEVVCAFSAYFKLLQAGIDRNLEPIRRE